jgi:hypothetical protein
MNKTQTKQAQVVDMNKKITTKDLHYEIEQIKNNHLAHMAEDIDDLKEAVKDNRSFFQDRLDRLDNRIWWVLGLSVTTMITVVAGQMIG